MFGLLVGVVLLGVWSVWFLGARVTLYELSDRARLEVNSGIYPIEAAFPGRVIASRLALGREVRPGEVLVELEADVQRLESVEERARLTSLSAQIARLKKELVDEEQAGRDEQQALSVARAEASARQREAEAESGYASKRAERLASLRAQGALTELDLAGAEAEALKRRSAVDALALGVNRLAADQRTRDSNRRARLGRLKREADSMEGQLRTGQATLARLGRELETYRIRAPVAGRLGEVVPLRVGAVVREGDKLAAVVPQGKLRVVADFEPGSALGRVRPGQSARLRLEGFPWTRYGSVDTTVSRVASEIRSGRVRVELALGAPTSIPLEHGMPGTVEVEVERVTPATLVLRSAGKLLTPALEAGKRVGR